MKSSLDFIIFSFICLSHLCHSQDILGCGGFIKSEVEINFAQIEVKLYTPGGSIKYQTDCAPNNGYFMVPVYDKGDYVLKVEPPPGWTFEPDSVELHIDGKTDICSKGEDINFEFTGFGVVGQVISKGQKVGPAGVTLALSKSSSKEGQREVQSGVDGSYTFEKVLPGDYVITATHPDWKFEKSSAKVTVSRETGKAGELVVRGYDVNGRVESEGDPVKGVEFALFSSVLNVKDISDCDKSPLDGLKDKGPGKQLCHVTSDEKGLFLFPSVPTGEYRIVPFYKGQKITFDVVPSEKRFKVEHSSVKMDEAFKVAGFSVTGRVVKSVNQKSGVPNAVVSLNGREVTKTQKDGTYHLDGMKTGHYRIEVTADKMSFDTLTMKVTANTPILPDIVASRFMLCGVIKIDQLPSGSQSKQERQVTLATKGSTESELLSANADGTFCTSVTPGTYVLSAVISDVEQKAGLRLAPDQKEVVVKDEPVDGIVFSQFRAQVSGTVQCLETCKNIIISLTSVTRSDDKQTSQANEVAKGASFHFDDVLPGKYKVTLHQDEWCWAEKVIEIEVTDHDVKKGVDFVQSGYILSCSLTHDIDLHFAHESKAGTVGSFSLSKGINKFCLAEPGVYDLRPESCHRFEKETYKYDTASPSVLTLAAVSHRVSGVVTTKEKQKDIIITIKSSSQDEEVKIGPLKLEKPSKSADAKKDGQKNDAVYQYTFEYWASSGEDLSISATSAELLFYPSSVEKRVSGEICQKNGVMLEGKRGRFIDGLISPPIGGVAITVSNTDGEDIASLVSDDKGKYRVGPLHADQDYSVTAGKEGYVLTPIENKLGHFQASKLAEVVVKVLDLEGQVLSGVLLSLSGGKQYRSNQLSDEEGRRSFLGLSPGQYFLRPMMKEYNFEPASQMVDVAEGATKTLEIRGKQVAFSCYGSVTSLNGEAEAGVLVEAVGHSPGECAGHQEESKTDSDGKFRIRGLQPGCMYHVQVQIGDMNPHIDRATPKAKQVKVEKADITDVNIIAFQRMNQLDISGNVITDEQYLSTLKVRLFKEDGDSPIHSSSLGSVSFFYLPSLTLDNKNYVLRLDSSLSRVSYDFSSPEISFKANKSYQHFTFHFNPKHKVIEEQIGQSSLLVLPLTALILLISYQYKKILPVFQQMVTIFKMTSSSSSLGSSSSSGGRQQINTQPTIDPELLEPFSTPNNKKKKKARKA